MNDLVKISRMQLRQQEQGSMFDKKYTLQKRNFLDLSLGWIRFFHLVVFMDQQLHCRYHELS
jgi:hypothetical protein